MTELENGAISPLLEMGAYEALWSRSNATFKTIADLFRQEPEALPSSFVSRGIAEDFARQVIAILKKAQIGIFGVQIHRAFEYPQRLREATHPIELFYYQGWWSLIDRPAVAVVGTRSPSEQGIARARTITQRLVQDGYTIVSGLAKGTDTVAHETAIEAGGSTIAVLGTSLSQAYPAANRKLQERIANEHLLISQVPVVRSSNQGPDRNRVFFPERNVTMSALTKATIIIEAGETSGTLVQAKAALKQGRKLFILASNFENDRLTWPKRFEDEGAIRVTQYDDIRQHLGDAS
jgi:DNA processing protein